MPKSTTGGPSNAWEDVTEGNVDVVTQGAIDTSQPVHKLVDEQVGKSVDQTVDKPVDEQIDQSANEPVDVNGDGVIDEYERMTGAELSERCKRRGLPSSGAKADLVRRLQADDSRTNAPIAQVPDKPESGQVGNVPFESSAER